MDEPIRDIPNFCDSIFLFLAFLLDSENFHPPADIAHLFSHVVHFIH